MDKEMDVPPEPPSCRRSENSLVLVGKNSRGQWVAQRQDGLFGGLFVDCKKAVRFALDENGHHPQSIVIVSEPLELDMSRKPAVHSHSRLGSDFELARVA
ncbi:MAG: hypothetical protein ACXWKA_20135 [Xanthobacteraceae bacterium]